MKPIHLPPDEKRLAQMMKALGNPTRLWIVRFLVENPMCITNDIVEATPLAQATVSQHLKVLREAGIVEGTVEGTAMCYCIDQNNLAWFKNKVKDLF